MGIMNLSILIKTILFVACGLIMATAIAQTSHISDEDKAYAAKVADFNFKIRKTLPFKREDNNMTVADLYIKGEALYSHIMIDDVVYQEKAEDFFKAFVPPSIGGMQRDCQLFFLIQKQLPKLEYVEIDYTFKEQTRNYIFQCAPKIS